MQAVEPATQRRDAHEAARLAKRLRHAVGRAIAERGWTLGAIKQPSY